MRKIWTKLFPMIIMKIQSEKISNFCFRTCCMTLVQKLGILCLPNHKRVKTGRRSPFYLNCSHVPQGHDAHIRDHRSYVWTIVFIILIHFLALCPSGCTPFSCDSRWTYGLDIWHASKQLILSHPTPHVPLKCISANCIYSFIRLWR